LVAHAIPRFSKAAKSFSPTLRRNLEFPNKSTASTDRFFLRAPATAGLRRLRFICPLQRKSGGY
jgi:hypothetical protein